MTAEEELKELRAFVLRLAEHLADASDVLQRLAEKKENPRRPFRGFRARRAVITCRRS